MNFSISTVFNIHKYRNWSQLLKEFNSLGFKYVELNVEVPQGWFSEIQRTVQKSEIIISGLHNFCPAVEPLPAGKTYFDVYLLTSDDIEERKLGIEHTKKTIEYAQSLQANYVIVHAGEVPIEISGRVVNSFAFQFGTNSMLYEKYKTECIKQREKKIKIYLDKLVQSLDKILEYAQKKNIVIALENRFYYNEIPIPSDLEFLLNKFNGSPLYYWHDTGHAEINLKLKFLNSQQDFLKPFKDRLYGLHLHDVKGLADHFAPGSGEIDFSILSPFLKSDTILVIEAHPKAKKEEIIKSKQYLGNVLKYETG